MPAKAKKTSKNNELSLKDQLLLKTLQEVLALGFSEEALLAGAKAAKIPAARALTLFPQLPVDLITHMADWADRQTLAAYGRQSKGLKRVRDKVALGVRLRLEALAPYKEAVREEVRILSKPWHVPLAAQLVFKACDTIWYAAGDASTDYNYYTKRGLLAGVLTTTTLRWLADNSEDHAQTWEFLDRRIENVMQIGKLTGRLKEGPAGMREHLYDVALKVKEKVRERRRSAA
jgi:ubiquinone biosynthesis protein COQ9